MYFSVILTRGVSSVTVLQKPRYCVDAVVKHLCKDNFSMQK